MRYLIVIWCLLAGVAANAQLPRNAGDHYEYAQQISVNAPDTVLANRAKSFFLTPFIIHWDSVAFVEGVHTGRGHVIIRIIQGLKGFNVPVAMTVEVAVTEGGFRYSIRHLEADKKGSAFVFPLEQKPDAVKPLVYEQLLERTHSYMGSVISLLKRHMAGTL